MKRKRVGEEGRFQIFGNIIMILFSLAAVIPLVLLLISSFTDDSALVRNGYSFFPEKWSAYAYQYIFTSGNSLTRAYIMSFVLTAVGVVEYAALT